MVDSERSRESLTTSVRPGQRTTQCNPFSLAPRSLSLHRSTHSWQFSEILKCRDTAELVPHGTDSHSRSNSQKGAWSTITVPSRPSKRLGAKRIGFGFFSAAGSSAAAGPGGGGGGDDEVRC